VTVATSSADCSGPTKAFTWAVFDPLSIVSVVAASILGNCHSYTVISRRCDLDTPFVMN
jgi:hypothetical protein